jgi:putative peptidoglycan lipid II flippase
LSLNLFSISMQAMFMGYLQKNQKFFFPASLAIPLNASIIIGILFSNPKNIFPLVIATAVGQLLCLLWLYIPMYRMEYQLKIMRKSRFLQDELGIQFMRMLPPTLIGTAAYQLNTLIDRSLASLLPSGNTSYLNYADKLQGIVYSIMVMALLTVLFPTQSEYASKKEFKKLYSLTRENLSLMLLLVFPLAVGLMFLSQEITQIAYMRNQFSYVDAVITGNILLCYGGIVLFQSTAEMFSRTFFAMKETKKQMFAALISIGSNIILNLILIRPLGVYGLALATTLAAFVRVAVLMWMSKDNYRQSDEKMLSSSIKKYFVSAMMMLGILIGFQFLFKDTLGLYGYSIISVIIGATVYFIVLSLLRTNELIQLRDMASGFVNRMRRNS